MACKHCSSDHQSTFSTEMNIHFPGIEGLDKPTVWVFPKVVVCLDCAFAEFVVPKNELHALVEGLTRVQTKSA
jgi:hypothetical protein